MWFDWLPRRLRAARKEGQELPDLLTGSGQPAAIEVQFERVFITEMAAIKLLSADQISDALKTLRQAGGVTNMTVWQVLYARFFEGHSWEWPWYNEWELRFSELGQYPTRWKKNAAGRVKFDLLMWALWMRAKSEHAWLVISRTGRSKWEPIIVEPGDESLIRFAMMSVPDRRPPFFPCDRTMMHAIPRFDEDED